MAEAIELEGITSGAVMDDGKLRLRAAKDGARVDLILPAQGIENTAILFIRLAHEAAQKRGDDEESGLLVDSLEMAEFDNDDRSTLLRAWSLGAPLSLVIDETLLVELEGLVRERLKTIRGA